MADLTSALKKAASQAVDTTKQLADAARGVASNVAEASQSAIQGLSEQTSNAAGYLEKQGENATGAMSDGLKTTARSIREHAPEQGPLKDTAYGVAQQFSNAAGYLDEQGLGNLLKDLSSTIKKSPLMALALGVGAGYLIGLITRNRD